MVLVRLLKVSFPIGLGVPVNDLDGIDGEESPDKATSVDRMVLLSQKQSSADGKSYDCNDTGHTLLFRKKQIITRID